MWGLGFTPAAIRLGGPIEDDPDLTDNEACRPAGGMASPAATFSPTAPASRSGSWARSRIGRAPPDGGGRGGHGGDEREVPGERRGDLPVRGGVRLARGPTGPFNRAVGPGVY